MYYHNIRELRQKKKMTQSDLAEQLGVNRATISKYESGNISPTIEQLKRIADILNVGFLDLIELSPEFDNEKDQTLLNQLITEYANQHGNVEVSKLMSIVYFSENGLVFSDENTLVDQLFKAFDSLNIDGQVVAIERIKELAEIPKYQKKNTL